MAQGARAQSSSPITYEYEYEYDVFLSFRGEDTRYGFTGNLYSALSQRGVLTFMDDHDLKKGEKITTALLRAIQKSRMTIVILSKSYASSTFCLNELVEILECYTEQNMSIWPVFYDVDPSDVRHQTGSYGEAFTKHERGRFRDDSEKLKKWKLALNQVADFGGSHYNHGVYEHVLIREIIKEVSRKIKRPLLHIAVYPVGLDARIKGVLLLIGAGFNKKFNMIGIHGTGGIGKSAIARAVYNLIASQFEGSCFIADVRELTSRHGLEKIQATMLSQLIGGRNFELESLNQGIPILKERKKVLLILDDVDNMDQLQAIEGGLDWFAPGSVIIITTRHKHLLDSHDVKKYEVKNLNHTEALELFRWKALKNSEAGLYMEITKRPIPYAGGLPLALETIGSNLFGKTLDEWNYALEAYERIPIEEDVDKILEVSYDGLGENEKEIFLDIACFFKGCTLRYVTNMLHARLGFPPQDGIRVLQKKSLINIWRSNGEIIVTMHNLIQHMGKEIVRKQSTSFEGRNRLWFHEDVVCILEKYKENDEIKAMMLDMPEDKLQFKEDVFGKMKNLMMLIKKEVGFASCFEHLPKSLRVLEWWRHPAASLPSVLHNLVILNLSYSRCFQWDKSLQMSEVLNQLIFTGCKCLQEIPDVSGLPNLKELCVDDCTSLIEIDDSVGLLVNLQRFSAKGCTQLKKFPHSIKWKSLEYLCLQDCESLDNFPEIKEPMEKLKFLDLEGTALKNLLPSVKFLKGLRRLHLSRCKMPENNVLSEIVQNLPNFFPELKTVRLGDSNLTILPACINECQNLKRLDLSNSKQLGEIGGLPPNIVEFVANNCTLLKDDCSTLNKLIKSQVIHSRIQFYVLPGQTIPEWFDHTSKGHSLCFWFRKEFPCLTVSAVLGVVDNTEHPFDVHFKFCFKINDIDMPLFNYKNNLEGDHIVIFNYITNPMDLDHGGLLSENEWNYGEVLFVIKPDSPDSGSSGSIQRIGVLVNQTFISKGHVRFTNPYPSKITCDDKGNQLRLCKADDKQQQQQQLASFNRSIPMSYEMGEQPLSYELCNSDSLEPAWPIDGSNNTDGAFLDHQAKDAGESSQVQRSTSTSGQVGPKLPLGTSLTMLPKTIDASLTNQTELTLVDDVEMEAFYVSLDAETRVVSSEEASKARRIVHDFISNNDASIMLHPERCSVMKTSLENLSNLSADHGISREMRTLLSEASREYTHFRRDYIEASMKIASTSFDLQRADELEIGLELNKKRFCEELASEHELIKKLARMEESKRKLEEKINVIKANISASQSEKENILNRKRDIFKEGKALQTQRDELREKAPSLKYEHGFAKETQSRMNSEWSELREKLKKIAEE
ncbi:TMV resistance protein N-like [Gastrolobium bilobum]|uniref:TMV resistance protein N-like n=1 Tax=Gastrolobium bilobum TaxID=150636 RepID=UPI002AAF5CD0|nr:TMV resistance protein N-like [Gastrolobium bilobum]